MIYRSLIITLIMAVAVQARSQEPWHLAKDKDGIQVFTRHVEGSSFKEYKAVAMMEGKLPAFVAAIKDISSYPDWIYNAEYSKLLDSTDTYARYYMQIHLPGFFVRNRDLVNVLEFSNDRDNNAVRIDVHAEPGYLPENDDYVRIPASKGYWRLEEEGNDSVRVTFQMHALPGGSIPSLVANAFIVDAPFSDFQHLRERCKMEKYQGRSFPFMER